MKPRITDVSRYRYIIGVNREKVNKESVSGRGRYYPVRISIIPWSIVGSVGPLGERVGSGEVEVHNCRRMMQVYCVSCGSPLLAGSIAEGERGL